MLTDYEQYAEKAKVLATFTSHCLHAVHCMDEVYQLESSYDTESAPTLAAGHLACALFCRALALEEEDALNNSPIPKSQASNTAVTMLVHSTWRMCVRGRAEWHGMNGMTFLLGCLVHLYANAHHLIHG